MALLDLTERDRRTFTKLHASADDISVARWWAQHIQKKRWYRRPWDRGKIYRHQSAYVTAVVVAYGRVFSTGRGGFKFPRRLIPYDEDEWNLHHRLLEMRHKVHAHSDLDKWRVDPWLAGSVSTTIVGQPINLIEEGDIELFLKMTEQLLTKIAERQEEILRPYRAAFEGEPIGNLIDHLMEAAVCLEVGEALIIPVKDADSSASRS